MRWNWMIFHCLDHLKFDGAEWSGMNSIPFHHLPSYFFSSNLGGMNNLSYSVLKFPNNGIWYSFCSAPFRFVSLCFIPFCSVHFMISKYSLKFCCNQQNDTELHIWKRNQELVEKGIDREIDLKQEMIPTLDDNSNFRDVLRY